MNHIDCELYHKGRRIMSTWFDTPQGMDHCKFLKIPYKLSALIQYKQRHNRIRPARCYYCDAPDQRVYIPYEEIEIRLFKDLESRAITFWRKPS